LPSRGVEARQLGEQAAVLCLRSLTIQNVAAVDVLANVRAEFKGVLRCRSGVGERRPMRWRLTADAIGTLDTAQNGYGEPQAERLCDVCTCFCWWK